MTAVQADRGRAGRTGAYSLPGEGPCRFSVSKGRGSADRSAEGFLVLLAAIFELDGRSDIFSLGAV